MAAEKKTTKTPSKAQAEKKAARAAIEEAALAAAARLDGMRLVELLGARYDDPRVAPLLTELGQVKPLTEDAFWAGARQARK